MIERNARGDRYPTIGFLPKFMAVCALGFTLGPIQAAAWTGPAADQPVAQRQPAALHGPTSQPQTASPSTPTRPVLSGQGTDVNIHHGASAKARKTRRHRRRTTRRSMRSRRRVGRRRRLGARRRRHIWTQRRTTTEPYAGITPGKVDRAPGIKPPAGCWLTWPGFQMTKTGSRIFLQFSERPQFHVDFSRRTITMLFDNCRIFSRNTRRRLITRYFATPVDQMRIRRKRKNIEVRIRLKAPMETRPTWRRIDGAWYLFADFPSWRRGTGSIKRRRASRRPRTRRTARRAVIRIRRDQTDAPTQDHEVPPTR